MTEHVPHRGDPDTSRMPWADFLPFNDALNAAIEKYSSQISIIKGFECEYIPKYLDDYRMMKEEYGYSLLHLGHHNVGPDHIFMFSRNKPDYVIRMYADEVCEGLGTGLFSFLAHPDLLIYRYDPGFDAECEKALRQIFSCCQDLKIPVEINGAGLIEGRPYPSREVFEMSKDYNLIYILNMDAHDPVYLTEPYTSRAESFVDSLGLRVRQRYFPKG